eukprot:TRINITY_DN72099_c0_g1_i1.p1 TRINITY_DN72099_c0_g1~~TRINITY_DN72099_c0_g1_i1.p1  ORF type:complete len:234 (-),score=22.93 TRINITY_DN72099_c0_g1_i1:498-1199(-)
MMRSCDLDCQSQILNAVTMFPPIASCVVACYFVTGKQFWHSNAAFCLVMANVIMLPTSCASHLYCAFHGSYSPLLIQLDQLGISIACIFAAWAMSKCHRFTYLVAFLSLLFDLAMFMGPEPFHSNVTWRMLALLVIVLMYLSPMVWKRATFDTNIIPLVACLMCGYVMAVIPPLGDWSHPLFHALLVPYTYFVTRSAVIHEMLLQKPDRFCVLEEEDEESISTDSSSNRWRVC